MLDGKVCVVTGSGGGIGRATAVEMARQGARVVVSDIQDESGARDRRARRGGRRRGALHPCDVREPAQVERADRRRGRALRRHRRPPQQRRRPRDGLHDRPSVDTLSDEVWTAVYEINLRGVWLATKHAAPYLRARRARAGDRQRELDRRSDRLPDGPAYCATKGAVIQLTKATAIDLAPDGVRANCYCPGAVDTPMTAKYFEAADDPEAIKAALAGSHLVPRLGTSEEVARLVCFLASDDASFINGAAITIDGGSLAWRGTNG